MPQITMAEQPDSRRKHKLVPILRDHGIGEDQFERLSLFERRFLGEGMLSATYS
jgi:hypothetical protein